MTCKVTVVFCCPHCSTAYQAAQQQTAQPCEGEFYCERCGTPVHDWAGFYDFTRWTAVSAARSANRRQRRRTGEVGATMMLP
jgi:hypothetical protein